ncbi:MAG: glycosyltransferase, partial [Bacteroidales bacterium]
DVKVLYYGYDEEDFTGNELSKEQQEKLIALEKKFVINHAGLLGIDRFPKIFLEVLSELVKESVEFKNDLLLYFPGEVDYSIKSFIRKLDLQENTVYPGHVSKDLAIESMKMSSLLLLPLNKAENVKGRLPGKLYEYLRSYTPLLALGPEDSDVNNILKQTQTGLCLNYDDGDKIKEYIQNVYRKYRRGESENKYSKVEISRFDVKNQTRILAGYLNELTNAE